jgi:hypothetical protein
MEMEKIQAIQEAFKWLEFRHNSMKELVKKDKEMFKSDQMQNMTKGMEMAVQMYEDRINELRQLLNGFMTEDVNLDGGSEEHVS